MTPQQQRNQHFVEKVGTPDYDPNKHTAETFPANKCDNGIPHQWNNLVCDVCGKDVS